MKTEQIIVGIDEAGRGPLAGPVIAAAVILDPTKPIDGLNDSKKLSAKERERIFELIRKSALAWSYAKATVAEIDHYNILQATLMAMQRAVNTLTVLPDIALIDGNKCPVLPCQTQAIIKGDQSEPVISAASIVAKVMRDRIMHLLDKKYPLYGFAKHKGYPTYEHLEMLRLHGPSRIHRRTFAPVSACL
jgi:ribonuclease HII